MPASGETTVISTCREMKAGPGTSVGSCAPRIITSWISVSDRRSGVPDADRAGLLVSRKGPPQQGKAVGQNQRSAQALQEPADDERRETWCESDHDRAQAIKSDPCEEDPLLPEPITQSPGDQGQGHERQEFGVHHPLRLERRKAHVPANRRERDRDDGAADEHEAAAQARRDEHLGAASRTDGRRFGKCQAAFGQD